MHSVSLYHLLLFKIYSTEVKYINKFKQQKFILLYIYQYFSQYDRSEKFWSLYK